MKVVIILILISSWLASVSGQQGMPCEEYDPNRTILQFEEILMRDGGVFYQNLRDSYVEAINYSIGKNVIPYTHAGMEDILENTHFVDVDFVVPSDYLNGVRYGDVIRFTTLTGQPSKTWAAYRYMGVDYIYAKISCMNPQKPKKPGVYAYKQKYETKNPTLDQIGKPKLDLSFPDDYGDYRAKNKVDLGLQTNTTKTKTWFGKNAWWLIPAGTLTTGALVGGGIYLINQSNSHSTPPPVVRPDPPVDTGGPGDYVPTSVSFGLIVQ